MLDINKIRKDHHSVEKALQTKDASITLKPIVEMDVELRKKQAKSETLRAQQKQLAQSIGKAKKDGLSVEELLTESEPLAKQIKQLNNDIEQIKTDLDQLLLRLPNIPDADVPVSLDPDDNVCIDTYGEKNTKTSIPNHVELNKKLKLYDFEKGANLSGSGWVVYRHWGARLEWALLNFMIDYHVNNNYEFILPPHLVRSDVMRGAGQLPKFKDQAYRIEDENDTHYLLPTAEVALNGMHMNQIIDNETLPIKYVSYTPCFRREAGAAGSSERGLIRIHQFNKVEMFAFSKPEESESVFSEFVGHTQRILEKLGLHHRTMQLVTGDTSFSAAKTIDVEVWLPGQNRYYEVSSISNCRDFQARRSRIRYKKGASKPQLVHTLNGSGTALPRLTVAILENNFQSDGSVIIPEALRPYMGNIEKLTPINHE
ncbi:serine--tRNA ligase [Chlamydiia bacterium]|nr:serine--tRNA ligase [Chlamydiia bacterium]